MKKTTRGRLKRVLRKILGSKYVILAYYLPDTLHEIASNPIRLPRIYLKLASKPRQLPVNSLKIYPKNKLAYFDPLTSLEKYSILRLEIRKTHMKIKTLILNKIGIHEVKLKNMNGTITSFYLKGATNSFKSYADIKEEKLSNRQIVYV